MPPFVPQALGGAGAGPAGAPPGGTGAASSPQGMPGAAAQAISAVKTALEALQKALPGLQMGSELHNAVLKAISEISKHTSKEEGDGASVVQQLAQLARQQGQGQPPAMMRPPMGAPAMAA